MKPTLKLQLVIDALLAIALNANATEPPDPVASDSHYNTAVGSYAIYHETTGPMPAPPMLHLRRWGWNGINGYIKAARV